MARPLPLPDPHRSGLNGNHHGRSASAGPFQIHPPPPEDAPCAIDNLELLAEEGRSADRAGGLTVLDDGRARAEAAEREHLRTENAQLRALCYELEQALQEAAQQFNPDLEQQIREYEAILEEKNELIRQLHQQLQETQAALEETKSNGDRAASSRQNQGAPPCEDELLALSEELERERRQLQEDEQTLMEQMREMEVGMARERAEIARQRNDLQRLQSEIRHELERLERNGAVQSKIEGLKSRLQDATARRGAAPGSKPASPKPPVAPPAAPSRKEGLMGRLFGRGGE